MGYPALLRVLEEEASREAREVRASAEREAARIVAEAREAVRTSSEALLARERGALEAARRTAAEALARERERTLLAEQRRHLDSLRTEILRRLPGAGSADLDGRLLAEVAPEIGEGPVEVVVDPGSEEAARAALEEIAPGVAARAHVRAATAPRGGVEVVTGRRVLDDTLPARLERAWPEIETELADLLLGEG